MRLGEQNSHISNVLVFLWSLRNGIGRWHCGYLSGSFRASFSSWLGTITWRDMMMMKIQKQWPLAVGIVFIVRRFVHFVKVYQQSPWSLVPGVVWIRHQMIPWWKRHGPMRTPWCECLASSCSFQRALASWSWISVVPTPWQRRWISRSTTKSSISFFEWLKSWAAPSCTWCLSFGLKRHLFPTRLELS